MKYILSSLLMMTILVSCQKELTEDIFNQPIPADTTVVVPSGNFTAVIDSVPWAATTTTAFVIPDSGTTNESFLITGSGNGKEIGIFLETFAKGTYNLNDTATFNGAGIRDNTREFSSDARNTTFASTVTITVIDTINKTVSGTFSFRAFEDTGSAFRTVTNGQFTDIPYTRDLTGILPHSPTDTFHVMVDSALFAPYSILTAEVNNTTMAIAVTDSINSEGLNLNFPYNITPGTYIFDTTTLRPFNYYYKGSAKYVMAVGKPGTLTILENNITAKRIRGNFSFTPVRETPPNDSLRLTQGYFSVKYP